MMKVDLQQYSPLTKWSTAFMVVHAAAEGCFIPFLTIYFRQLGLSSSNIGILLGIRIFVGTSSGLIWCRLCQKFRKQRALLIISVVAAILFRIGLAVIPPLSLEFLLEYCAESDQSIPHVTQNSSTPMHQLPVTEQYMLASEANEHFLSTSIDPRKFLHPESSVADLISRKNRRNTPNISPSVPSPSVAPFVTSMTVVVLGELFASSGIQLVTASLYHRLDDSDRLHYFPAITSLCTLSHGVVAVVIAGAVDRVPCIILEDRSSMVVQIGCSVSIMIVAAILSMCLPLFQPHSLLHSTNRTVKAFRFLSSDLHHAVLVSSCAVLGFLTSAASGFLFWHLQDLGGTEFTMGLYLFLESVSHAAVRSKSRRLVQRLGHFGVFGVNFLCLSLTYLYLGVMWNPWMILLVTPPSGFVRTLFWRSVADFLEQTAPPGLYHHMYKHSEVFAALGAAFGYVSIGFLGSVIRFKAGFVVFGILASVWGLVSLLVMRFSPRKETVHYAQLFRSSEDSEEELVSDDWLEKALEEDRTSVTWQGN